MQLKQWNISCNAALCEKLHSLWCAAHDSMQKILLSELSRVRRKQSINGSWIHEQGRRSTRLLGNKTLQPQRSSELWGMFAKLCVSRSFVHDASSDLCVRSFDLERPSMVSRPAKYLSHRKQATPSFACFYVRRRPCVCVVCKLLCTAVECGTI